MPTRRRFSSWGVDGMPTSRRNSRLMIQGSFVLLVSVAQRGDSFLLNPSKDAILPPSLLKNHRFLARRRNEMVTRLAARFPERNYNRWDGDDVRWTSRLRRRWLGSIQYGMMNRSTIMSTSLQWTTLLVYLYQAYNTIYWIRQAYPASWPSAAPSIVMDTLLGSARAGPFTTALCYTQRSARLSPWRYLTSGLLHSSILHWAFTMDALRRLPGWLEELGGGKSFRSSLLYMTTFWVATVCGNLASQGATEGWMVGASGGIAGLYGLMFVSLIRMSNPRATSRTLRGAGFLFLYGCLVEKMSNASHVGGFLAGIALALLAGPRYRQSYSLRRKNTLATNTGNPDISRAYSTAMGYDKRPMKGLVPLWVVWVALFAVVYQQVPQFRLPL